jgi:hypothetical protein
VILIEWFRASTCNAFSTQESINDGTEIELPSSPGMSKLNLISSFISFFFFLSPSLTKCLFSSLLTNYIITGLASSLLAVDLVEPSLMNTPYLVCSWGATTTWRQSPSGLQSEMTELGYNPPGGLISPQWNLCPTNIETGYVGCNRESKEWSSSIQCLNDPQELKSEILGNPTVTSPNTENVQPGGPSCGQSSPESGPIPTSEGGVTGVIQKKSVCRDYPSPAEWDACRERLSRLYIDDGWTLEELMLNMYMIYGFKATYVSYLCFQGLDRDFFFA